jgi:hypothetical protein
MSAIGANPIPYPAGMSTLSSPVRHYLARRGPKLKGRPGEDCPLLDYHWVKDKTAMPSKQFKTDEEL